MNKLLYLFYNSETFTENPVKGSAAGAPAGEGEAPTPAKPEKLSQKMVLFSRSVLSDKGPGNAEGKWVKIQTSTEIFVCEF